jgi:hypothetical protein
VSVTDVDFLKDLIHLQYDPGKVQPEQIVEVVRKQGFQGTIVPGKGKGN